MRNTLEYQNLLQELHFSGKHFCSGNSWESLLSTYQGKPHILGKPWSLVYVRSFMAVIFLEVTGGHLIQWWVIQLIFKNWLTKRNSSSLAWKPVQISELYVSFAQKMKHTGPSHCSKNVSMLWLVVDPVSLQLCPGSLKSDQTVKRGSADHTVILLLHCLSPQMFF